MSRADELDVTMSNRPSISVIIVAAGQGRRFGDPVPKQYHPLGGKPVLAHSLAVFAAHPRVDQIVVAAHRDWFWAVTLAATGLDTPLKIVAGGENRQDSVRRGLEAVSSDWVLIHDAVRPGVTADVINGVLRALEDHAGAVPALPLADTLKRDDGTGMVTGTQDRAHLWRAQTPQGFHAALLRTAHHQARGLELTDDCAVMEAAGHKVALTEGEWRNDKITRADDLDRALTWLPSGPPRIRQWEYRTGSGYDVHRFEDGDTCCLCGITVPHDRALQGHSDADVGLHALTDALLGAVGAGDIGQHFPPSDDRWRGAASDVFLKHAGLQLRLREAEIANVDVTLICERPKIGPYREAMRARLAGILQIDKNRVSVKATTTEKLGFTGRQEGIAAQALATVRLPYGADS